MRIVVCVKEVAYMYHPTAIDPVEGRVDPEKLVFMPNPYDEICVEEALKVKEGREACEITIITVGPKASERTLRYACAMGGRKIDRMLRVNSEGCDPWTTALALSSAIERLGFDIIFCGKKAIDTNDNVVGSFVAEFLHIPQVSGVVKLDVLQGERNAVAERYLGQGNREEVECALPALFIVDAGLNDPRYPTLPDRIAAANREIEQMDLGEFALSGDAENVLTKITKFIPPRPKTRKMFTPDSNLSPLERLNLMMSGGGAKKDGGDVLEGAAEDMASNILKFLLQNELLNERETE